MPTGSNDQVVSHTSPRKRRERVGRSSDHFEMGLEERGGILANFLKIGDGQLQLKMNDKPHISQKDVKGHTYEGHGYWKMLLDCTVTGWTVVRTFNRNDRSSEVDQVNPWVGKESGSMISEKVRCDGRCYTAPSSETSTYIRVNVEDARQLKAGRGNWLMRMTTRYIAIGDRGEVTQLTIDLNCMHQVNVQFSTPTGILLIDRITGGVPALGILTTHPKGH
ncbi:hypothetical protein JAAARDRAFT_49535 [Jaapia argillacea MUCL 33604]|uniref:Uncharacterized protein n=1 Tax=Jaapia argillacea MUCL 33604 TaxID=933084 RepID=A0A067PJ84_9AGAM|nr:hypothetical protein JAAARDRAFT_49535 [Jaapia argillacea MUCL 33604]